MKPHFGLFLLLAVLVIPSSLSLSAEPASRPFALGLTPHNFDDTPEGTQRMKRLLREHAEIFAVYFENGVPWPEALEGKPFHANAQKEIAALKDRIGPNHKVFLGLNAVAFNRQEMAAYWGEGPRMPRPDRWAGKSFDDPEIIKAFGNFCERMIEIFHPDYLTYVGEVNMLAGANPKEFEKFMTLAAEVYPRLKKAHPKMLIFPTMERDYHFKPNDMTAKTLRRLLPYSDAVAINTYPHIRGFTAATLPADWFSALHDVAPEKPFIVAETGFPADRYEGKAFYQSVTVAGTPEMQRDYVRRLLSDAHRLKALYVNWFFPEDINTLLRQQQTVVSDPTLAFASSFSFMWLNNGLVDEKRQSRPAMGEWDAWRVLPLKPGE